MSILDIDERITVADKALKRMSSIHDVVEVMDDTYARRRQFSCNKKLQLIFNVTFTDTTHDGNLTDCDMMMLYPALIGGTHDTDQDQRKMDMIEKLDRMCSKTELVSINNK